MERAGALPPPVLLVVDDNRLIREMVRDFFTPHGYRVESAEDGARGLEILDRVTPDLILADILMPVMDGWAFYEAVRKRGDTAETPVIFLTVERQLPMRLRGLHVGADDYVTKPFEIEELHARVERILDRRRALDRARRGDGALLAGSVQHLALADLVQILAMNGKACEVELVSAGDRGRIVLDRGNLLHAENGRSSGTKALVRMLGWTEATFRVLPFPEAPPPASLGGSAENAVMDGLVALDEWNRWSKKLPDLEAAVELAPDARARMKQAPVSPAVLEIVSLAKQGGTVRELLDGSSLPDAQLAEALVRLVGRGVIRVGPA
jgi:DNA-binding response OmpR family regulator